MKWKTLWNSNCFKGYFMSAFMGCCGLYFPKWNPILVYINAKHQKGWTLLHFGRKWRKMTRNDAEWRSETHSGSRFQSMAGKLTQWTLRGLGFEPTPVREPDSQTETGWFSDGFSRDWIRDCLNLGGKMCYLINFNTLFPENGKV